MLFHMSPKIAQFSKRLPIFAHRFFSTSTTSAHGRHFYEYPILDLPIDPLSFPYSKYNSETTPLLRTFQKNLEKILQSSSGLELNKKRKKLGIRERVTKLLDPGSPFLEFSQFAGYKLYENEEVPSAGLITGVGLIQSKLVMIIANDPAVKAGSYFPITCAKHVRAQEIAFENRLPCVYLADSGGAYLPMQDCVFPGRDHAGRFFFYIAKMSAAGIPQIAIALGLNTGGGAYIPSIADENIIVKGNGAIFLGSPALVRAATGEIVTNEDLGGADVHCRLSGVGDHFANNEIEAFQICRNILDNKKSKEFHLPALDIEDPLFSPEELNYIMSPNLKQFVDVNYIIARIVDGSKFLEYKKNYGHTLVTGFAKLYGQDVGIIANNGVLFSESAMKGANFIEICSERNIPLIFMQNIMGFMVGRQYETEGIAKHGAKLVTAVATTSVPKLTLIFGGSFGAGNFGMCGRAYDPRFLFMWPWSKISVMGGEQAASVLTQIKKEGLMNTKSQLTPEQEAAYRSKIEEKYEKEGSCYYSSARLWDDGIILPSNTRKVLGLSLLISLNNEIEKTKFGIFKM